MNKRKHHRITVPNLTVEVSCGADCFLGTANDVSRQGILLDNIPHHLAKPNEILSIVIVSSGKKFKMLAYPRWIAEGSIQNEMGIEFLDASADWKEFVRIREPKLNNSWTTATFLPDS